VVLVFRDCSVRRQADAVQRERLALQDRLAKIADNAAECIFVTDAEGRVTFINPEAERTFGFTSVELLGQLMHDRIHHHYPDGRPLPMSECPFSEVYRSGQPVRDHEDMFFRKDGSPLAVNCSNAPLEIDGLRVGAVLIARDISERKRAEAALSASNLGYRSLFENMLDGYAHCKMLYEAGVPQDFVYLSVNPAFERLTGLKDVLGRRVSEVIPGIRQHNPELFETYDRVIRSGKPERFETYVVGLGIWLAISVYSLESEHFVAVFDNVTARKRAEEFQLRSQKLEALGTLAGGIAHDFNNILLAIGGNTKLAIADLPRDHAAQRSLGEISKATDRAADLVRRILSFSRPQEQKRETFHLQPVVEEALHLLRATLPAMIEIRTQFEVDVPAVVADSTQVHQIIVNLATNAADAIGPRRGLIELRLDAVNPADVPGPRADLPAGRCARLSVSDSGCGMERAVLERIFDPFFTTKPAGVGTGLGLSVVHGIMKSRGGAVTVYSEPGKGTTFRLYFPAAEAAADAARREQRKVAHGKGEHVLYVDDDEALVILATRVLERLGYKVTGHTDATKALQDFRGRADDFDVVVTDLSMPGISGFELARELLAIRSDVPILMTSGYVQPEDRTTALQMGIRDVILKPDTVEDLGEALERLFSKFRG
jgi:PAS domain S-box-containing protein